MFSISVSEIEKGKTDDYEDEYLTYAAIVTRGIAARCGHHTIAQEEGNSQVVFFHAANSSVESERRLVPSENQGTFKGYVTKETDSVTTCLIPMRITIESRYLWEMSYESSAGLESRVPEGIALVDGGLVPACLHTSLMQQIDDLTANYQLTYTTHTLMTLSETWSTSRFYLFSISYA